MKKILILFLLFFSISIFAEGLDDLGDDTDKKTEKTEEGNNLSGLDSASEKDSSDESVNCCEKENKFNINGYVKVNMYFLKGKDYLSSQGYASPNKVKNSKIGTVSQLRFEGDISGKAHFFTAFNLEYNQIEANDNNENPELKPRIVEAYIDLYFDWLNIRAGQQLITWGKTDGFDVPTDRISPRDFTYLSSEYEDLKLAVPAMQLSAFFSNQKLELIWIPTFQANIYPSVSGITENRKESYLENSEAAIQLSGTLGKFDYAVSYFYGWDRNFDFASVNQLEYNRMHSPGLDFSFPVSDILIKGSGALFYTKDWDGDDLNIKNSYATYILGMEYIKGSSSVGIQVGQKYIINYKNANEQNILLGQEDDVQNIVTGTINLNFFPGDALNFKTLFTGNFNNKGENWAYAIQPVITYKVTDGVNVVLGASFIRQSGTKRSNYLFETKYSF